MKVFENQKVEWNTKTNFVDDFNVVVGFDTYQSCCEHAGWYITPTEPTVVTTKGPPSPSAEVLAPYRFDATYCMNVPDAKAGGCGELDEGASVCFRLHADGKTDLFLVLFNAHNGYYGHGFAMMKDGKPVKDGTL